MKPIILATGAIGGWWAGFVFRTDGEKVMLLSVVVFVLLDWFTGIAAAFKQKQGINLSKMFDGLYKLGGFIALTVAALTAQEMGKVLRPDLPHLPLLSMALGCTWAAFGASMLKNIHRLTGSDVSWLAKIVEGLGSANEEKRTPSKKPKA